MVSRPSHWSSFRTRSRALVAAVLVLTAGAAGAACGASSPAGAPPTAGSAQGAATGSCTGIPGAHHARLVVETTRGKVLARCVGFSGSTLPALKLLRKSHVELGTQTFSFGVAICQVDGVPAHYSQCLPSGQDYWALFLSTDGHRWTSPSVGVSDVTVPPGGSIGLRYDSPKGKAAAPPHPSPA